MKYYSLAFLMMIASISIINCGNVKRESESKDQITLDCDPILKLFFRNYSESTDKAFDQLFATSKYGSASVNKIKENTAAHHNNIVKRIGNYKGYYMITQKSIGADYIITSYLVKYELQPIRFNIILYRSDNEWQLSSFTID